MQNKVQLITYADRLSGAGLAALRDLLMEELTDLFGTVHILSFFTPYDGADAGFDPRDHTAVDERLGSWDDVKAISADVNVMADLIVNHISADSPQFEDFAERGAASPDHGLFLTLGSVFPNGATEENLLRIYRPRPGLPFTYAVLKNGAKRILWTTFTSQQLDNRRGASPGSGIPSVNSGYVSSQWRRQYASGCGRLRDQAARHQLLHAAGNL